MTRTVNEDIAVGCALRAGRKTTCRVSAFGLLLFAACLFGLFAAPTVAASSRQQDDTLSSIGYVFSIAFSPDGQTAATGHLDGAVRIWDVRTGAQLRVFPEDAGGRGADAAAFVAFMPGGAAVLAATRKSVRVWSLPDGGAPRRFEIGRGEQCFALAPDGKILLTGNAVGVVTAWELLGGKPLRTYKPFRPANTGVSAIAYGPDGRSVLVAGELAPTIARLDLRTGRVGWRVRAAADYSDYARAVAVSPDGTRGVSGGLGGGVKLWDMASGKLLRSFRHPLGKVHRVVFSPSGKMIATTGDPDYKQEANPHVLLWDAATGERLRRLVGHTREVRAVAFSPDGKWLLSGGMNARLRLWDVESGAEVRSFPLGPKEPAHAAVGRRGAR